MMKLSGCMCAEKYHDVFYFLLRVVLGVVFLYHGWMKWLGGIEATATWLAGLGVPASLLFAWILILVEILGGLALILGVWTHWAAKLLAINMLVAMFLVHFQNGFSVSSGGYEFVLVLFVALLFVMSHGSGKWSLGGEK